MTGPEPVPSVEQQRAELAATVDELAQRVDVPARTKAAAHEKVEAAKQTAAEKPQIVAAVVGSVVAALAVRAVVRRRRRR
ncbi:membrane protein [Rhodococcus ruber Chol-4]|uniref:Putative membrane protein n=1 Tax=Rhodococcus ruber TaxID=1830 RepID=A0A098BQZ1_9NOCA|nr:MULTISPECIES: DUF3618 domain-containing protein [Rhodococcus]MDO2376883.1 DUF3618 domain-containing protein [Rhodococcus ruber]RIK13310.1 MAG: DUF3618 domain-containing protein [Acidobacteriota bacterium]ATQ31052.1 DUF3618 domain-containing protein [Rhodococcus ruber]AUM16319.1 DUF3618 domain-containing protein [Rhodococcus ruber]AWG97995.1 DUF3618 domain-containing protein [Rhodococcus ruber]